MSRLLNYTGKEKSSDAILKDYECDGQMRWVSMMDGGTPQERREDAP